MSEPKHPDVSVRLSGHDGNAMAVVSRVRRALKAGDHADSVPEFTAEAMSGDYDHLL